jgi:Protein of unknown function (DUF2490)
LHNISNPSHLKRKTIIFYKFLFAIIFLVFLNSQSVFAQKTFEVSNIQWFGHTLNLNLSKKLDFVINNQERRKDFLKTQNLILVRPGLNFRLNDKLSFAAGYSYLRSFQTEEQNRIENRIWEQVSFSPDIKNIDLTARLRLEQRNSFLKNNEGPIENRAYENRYRFQLKWNKKLNTRGKKDVYLTANDEFMFKSPAIIQELTFDQNRIYGGLGCKFNNLVRLELGYMHVFQPTSKVEVIKINHLFVLNIYSVINLRNEE